jgi:heme/copper-type cytochrome/quinol oxidase subunit 2
MSRRSHVALASVALAAMALLTGCGEATKTDHLSVEDGPVAGGAGITPERLATKTGNIVEIKVKNTAPDKPHGFSIDEFKVAETVDQGKTATVKFTASKAGTYRVYCQLHPTHKAAELVVS